MEHRPWHLPLSPVFVLVLAPITSFIYLYLDSGPFLSETVSRGQTIGRDFAQFWAVSVMAWRGDALAAFTPSLEAPLEQLLGADVGFMNFPYPPPALLYLLPLAALPYLASLTVWLGTTFAALAALLWRRFGRNTLLILAIAMSPASIVNIVSGQNGYLSTVLLCGGLLLLDRRPILAGILIGLLSYKPQLGLLLPFLLIAGGYWKSFAAASLTVLLLIAASFIFPGAEAWRLYLTEVAPHQMVYMQHGTGIYQQMTPSYFMAGRVLNLGLPVAWTLQAIATVSALAAILWSQRQQAPRELKIAIALVAVFLATPYGFTYEMLIVYVALLLGRQCFVETPHERLVFVLVWLFPVFAIFLPVPLGPVILTALLVLFLRRMRMMANLWGPDCGPRIC